MKGYALFKKGEATPIRLTVKNDRGRLVDVIVFANRGALRQEIDDEDEEIRRVEVR